MKRYRADPYVEISGSGPVVFRSPRAHKRRMCFSLGVALTLFAGFLATQGALLYAGLCLLVAPLLYLSTFFRVATVSVDAVGRRIRVARDSLLLATPIGEAVFDDVKEIRPEEAEEVSFEHAPPRMFAILLSPLGLQAMVPGARVMVKVWDLVLERTDGVRFVMMSSHDPETAKVACEALRKRIGSGASSGDSSPGEEAARE